MSQPLPITLSAAVEIHAAEKGTAPRRFTVDAYTGGELKVRGYRLPIVVDLAGLAPDAAIVANLDHDPAQRVGHVTELVNDGRRLQLKGDVSAASKAAEEFTTAADNKFPWRASIEAMPDAGELVELAPGKTAQANGRTFQGPLYIARKSTLGGVAFLSKGADPNTRVVLASKGKKTMPEVLTPELPEDNTGDEVDLREAEVQKIHARFNFSGELIAKGAKDAARVLAGAMTPESYERNMLTRWHAQHQLQEHRATLPQGPQIRASRKDVSGEVIEAALCQTMKLPGIENYYREDVLDAAHKQYRGRLGIQQVLIMAAAERGYHFTAGERITTGNIKAILRYALPTEIEASSTLSLPGLLSNVANKSVQQGYVEDDTIWRKVSQIKPVSDFKQATSYTMLDNMEYEEVGKDGKLANGQLGEQSYTRQAKTYGKFWSLTRVDIVNDDTGAFNDLRTRLGRGASKKFNRIFWGAWLNNSAFYTAARGNYITGATTTLLSDGVGLQLGVTAFRKLTTPDNKRVGGKPVILLHPPEVEFAARRLYQSTNVNPGGNNTADNNPDGNIHAGLYEPVTADYLSDPTITGYSDKEWYLLRDPAIAAAVCVSFLDGNEFPTIQTADAAFDTLGVDFRGFHDFGVDDTADYIAGVKSKAAA